ncbi:MAG: hypothetical protein HYZ74_08845, partial [Elusimicrobia bacterium]|nr:hypothetical protein [Elusimicrobiota bacterium]
DSELTAVHQELAGKSREADAIKMESAELQRESAELKRQLAGLEERLASVRQLSETLDMALEEEKRVEHDVEKQGQTLGELAREVEALRKQLEERRAVEAAVPVAAPLPAAMPQPKSFEPAPKYDFPGVAAPAAALSPLPTPAAPSGVTPPPVPDIMSFPSPAAAGGFDPMFGAASLTSTPAAPPSVPESEPFDAVVPPPAPAKGKKILILAVALLGVGSILAVIGGLVPGMRKPKVAAPELEPAPLPPPELAPAPLSDPRQSAVDLAKDWPLSGGRTLGAALETIAPASGNLSPWMAETLAGGRVQVNYFARSSAPGAPTIAYEFEVDLEVKTLVGRNAAAKSVLTGKAAAPPAPPKAKPVKVKPKVPAAKELDAEESTLDSMLGEPAPEAKPAPAPEVKAASAPEGKPRRPSPARRAAKAAAANPDTAQGKATDESLLDDLLQE